MPKRIKIIQIIPTLDIGGAERLLVDLASNFNRDLFEVKVICLKRFGVWGLELKKAGVEMFLINQKHNISFLSLFKLIKLIKRERPDIVQTHLFGADIYGKLAAKMAGVKQIISTEHNLNYNEGRLKRLAKRLIFKRSCLIAAVSEAVKEYIIKYEGATADKVKVINNGVKIEKFLNYGRDYVNKQNIIVGSLGRLTEQKGFGFLIEALAELPNQNFECWLAGDGELKTRLQEKIKKLGLENKVKFLGWQKDSRAFLDKIDIFVMPSLWEGFGISVLEAGLNGLPVLASRVDGLKEIINDKQTGLLFNFNNKQEFIEKLENLINNPNERRKLGQALREQVKIKYDIKSICQKYQELYLELARNYENSVN